jgi:hypothetical protein
MLKEAFKPLTLLSACLHPGLKRLKTCLKPSLDQKQAARGCRASSVSVTCNAQFDFFPPTPRPHTCSAHLQCLPLHTSHKHIQHYSPHLQCLPLHTSRLGKHIQHYSPTSGVLNKAAARKSSARSHLAAVGTEPMVPPTFPCMLPCVFSSLIAPEEHALHAAHNMRTYTV